MSDERVPAEVEAAPRLPFLRWALLLALLLVEGLTLSISYDSDALDDLPAGGTTFVLRHPGSILRVGSVVIACFFLIVAARGRRAASTALRRELAENRFLVPLGAH